MSKFVRKQFRSLGALKKAPRLRKDPIDSDAHLRAQAERCCTWRGHQVTWHAPTLRPPAKPLHTGECELCGAKVHTSGTPEGFLEETNIWGDAVNTFCHENQESNDV